MGTYWPRSNSFEFDDNGDRAPGAKVYFFNAGTSTPRTTYSDAALSTANAHPVVADGNGRWPQIFLQFGSYKEVATTSGGTTLWETDDIPNPAPTDPAEGVAATSIFQTGQIIFAGANAAFTGFVRCNGRTIGSATSGATERANADTANLYAYLWNNYTDTACPVSGGRGASAAADFAANKAIGLPDCRATVLGGFDDMGASALTGYAAAPVIGGSGILAGSLLGHPVHTLTEAQVPIHAHAVNITSAAGTAHSHGDGTYAAASNGGFTPAGTITDSRTWDVNSAQVSIAQGGGGAVTASNLAGAPNFEAVVDVVGAAPTFTGTAVAAHTHDVTGTSGSESAHTHLVNGNTGNIGSGTAHNNMQRTMPVTVLMKL